MKDFAFVYVGDYGQTYVSKQVLTAYGIKKYPINNRSARERRILQNLETNIKALQHHAWVMGGTLDSL